jgi:ipoprotein LpqH
VHTRSLVVAVAVVVIGAAGCSSQQGASPPRGTLPPGTAELSLDGGTARVTEAVQCESIEWMRTIQTGDKTWGVHVMLSNAKKLVAEFVRLHSVDGFNGSYDRHLQGEAAVTMTGPTYRIAGTAVGFSSAKATAPTTEPFELRVSC